MENVTDENYIALICNGEFDAIPDFTIGELFESFFDNINYNVVKIGEDVFVDFTGETICNDKDAKILIRFIADGENDEFAIVEVKIDNELLEEDEVMDLLEDIAFVAGTIYDEENAIFEDEEHMDNLNDIDDLEEDDYDDDMDDLDNNNLGPDDIIKF